jgi:endonuclease YncB( thermonuclease family)
VIELLQVGTMMRVNDVQWDKYGGRIDAFVYTKDGINVGKTLIDEGLAVSYSGRGVKRSWCN